MEKSEVGLNGRIDGMTVMALLAFTMRLACGGNDTVEESFMAVVGI